MILPGAPSPDDAKKTVNTTVNTVVDLSVTTITDMSVTTVVITAVNTIMDTEIDRPGLCCRLGAMTEERQ